MSKHLTFNNQIYFSSQEAGKTAGYTSDYVAKLCREGNLTCERVGRSWFVEENSLKEFVIAREHEKATRLQQLSEQRKSEYYEQEIEEAELPKVATAAVQSAARVAQPVVQAASRAVQAQEYAYFDPYTYTFAQAPITGTYFRKILAEQEDQRRAQRALVPYTPIVPADTFREFGQKTVALLTAFAIVFGSTAVSGEQYLAAPARIAEVFDRSVQVVTTLPQTFAAADDAFEDALLAFDTFTTNPRLPELNHTVLAQVNAIEWLQSSYDSVIAFFRGAGTRLVTNASLIGSGNVRGQVDIQIRAVQQPSTAVADAGATNNTTPTRIVYTPSTTAQASERTTIVQNQPVIERVVETERVVVQNGVTLEQLQQTENELRKEIARVGADNATDIGDNFHSIALTQRIDTLGGVLISNSRIRNSSIEATSLTVADDASFGEDVTIAGALTVTGTTTFSSLVANDLTYTGTLTTPLGAGIAHINGSGALTSATGTANTIVKFNAAGTALADSILIDDGAVVTVGGALTVSGTSTLATTTITDATITNLSGTNATLTNATSTNFFSSVLTAITGAFTNFSATNATTTNLVATNATTTNLVSSDITTDGLAATGTSTLATTSITNATVTDIIATNATSTNLVVTGNTALASTTITDADVTRLVATYATTTTLFGANATFTNATSTNFFSNALTAITGAFTNVTATNATTTNLVATDATVTDLSATDAVFTNATSTNFFTNLLTAVTGAFTNLTATNATSTNLVATNATTTNLVATGTTTLATTTITDATITDANITRLIASYATTTTLFGANATFTDAVFTNATSTNFYSNLVTAITGIFTNLTATNATTTNLVATNATTTNLVVTGDTALGTTTIGAVSVDSIDATNATFTNATSTNFFSNILTAITGVFTNLTATNATTTNLVVTGSADLATTTINGILTVDGGAIVIGNTNTDTLTINSAINSDIIPDQNAVRDLGSPSYFWDEIYADNINVNSISAASTTIGGTANNSFTINTDNVTPDNEDVNLVFFRGTVVPNAVIAWDSDTERFDINQPFYIQNDSSTTTVPTLQLVGKTGQTAPLLVADTSAGSRVLTVTHTGNVGIGTSSPSAKLAVSGNAYVSGTTTLYGGLTVSTGTVSLPAGQIDNVELANSTVSYGGITLSLGDSDATPAFNLIDATGLPIDAGTTGTLPVARGGTGATTLNNLITLGTHTTGNYLATLADAGNNFFTVANSGTESAAVTLDIVDDSFDFAQFKDALTLDASTTVNVTGTNEFSITNTGSGNSFVVNDSAGDTTPFVISAGGNVGIHTNAPAYTLDVRNPGGDTLIGIHSNSTGRPAGIRFGVGTEYGFVGYNGSTVNFGSTYAFGPDTSISNKGTEYIRLSGGNVGIGTTSPAAKLNILGTSEQLRLAYDVSNYWTDTVASDGGRSIAGFGTDADLNFDFSGATDGDFSVNTNDLFVDTSTGRVGIGTTNPGANLHIEDAASPRISVVDTDGGVNTFMQSSDTYSRVGTASDINFFLLTNNTNRLTITNTGNVGIGDTSPAALFTVGNGDLFQVNSSGAIAAATGITSSGTITFSGLTNGILRTNGSGVLSTTTINGSDVTADTLDFTEFKDALTLDATTTVAMSYPLNFDSNTLYIDPATNRVGVGTATPSGELHIYDGTGGANFYITSGTNANAQISLGDTSQLDRAAITYRNATDDLGIKVNGSEHVTIGNTGNVGIGTTSPAAPLQITHSSGSLDTTLLLHNNASLGTGNGASILFRGKATNDMARIGAEWQATNDYDLTFYTGGSSLSEKVRITGDGNVGIGTTSPSQKLSIGSGNVGFDSGYGLTWDNTSIKGYNTAKVIAFNTNGAEAMRIINNGNIGIGTTTPAAKLQILGTSEQLRLAYDASTYWTDTVASDGGRSIAGFGTDADLNLDFSGATDGDFSVNTNDFVVDTSTGYIGIGTTSPERILHVITNTSSSSSEDAPVVIENIGSRQQVRLALSISGDTSANSRLFGGQLLVSNTAFSLTDYEARPISFWTGASAGTASERLTILPSGNVGIGDTSPAALFTVGNGDLFQVNSSGAIAAATGITSSGTITFSDLTNGILRTNGSGVLATTTINGSDVTADTLDFTEFKDALTLDATTTVAMSYPLNFDSNTLYIDPTNNRVGVGTASPTRELEVSSGNTNTVLRIRNTANSAPQVELSAASGNTYRILSGGTLNGSFSGKFAISDVNGSIPYLAITSTGNVGIGEISPGSKLSVSGGATIGASYDTTAAPTNGLIVEGNVGIGTTSPSAKLNISSAYPGLRVDGSDFPGIELVEGDNSNKKWIQVVNGGRFFIAEDNFNSSNQRFEIFEGGDVAVGKNGGSLGIGTTSPLAKLDVVSTSTQFRLGYSLANYWTDTVASDGGRSIAGFGTDADLNFDFSGATDGDFSVNTNDLFVDTSSGYVGVGTASPSNPFHVLDGTGQITALIENSGIASARLQLKNTEGSYQLISDGDVFTIRSDTLNERVLNITSTGNVGIRDDNPAYTFTVGAGDAFGVNSTGAIAAATGITSSGTITFSGLTNGILRTNGSGVLSTTTINGSDVTADTLDFTEFKDALTLDATTTVAMSYPLNFDSNTLYIDPTNNRIGVGTANPAYALDVNGDISVNSTIRHGGSSNRIVLNNAGAIQFYAGNTIEWNGSALYSNPHDGVMDLGKTSNRWRTLYLGTSLFVGSSSGDKFVVNSSGNVGIGTTTPAAKLDVWGNLRVGTSATPTLFADTATGNVGIGATVPTTKLFVDSGAVGSIAQFRAGSVSGAPGISLKGISGWGQLVATTGEGLSLGSDNSADKLVIDSSGNVGIGTTSPAGKLHILGTSEQLRLAYDASTYWTDTTASDGGRSIAGFGTDADLNLDFSGATDGDFSVNTNDLFVDTSTGRVGIGTTNPEYTLTVSGTQLFTSGGKALYFYHDTYASHIVGYDGDYNDIDIRASSGIGSQLYLDTGGNVGIGTTSPATKLHVSGGDIAIDNAQKLRWYNSSGSLVDILRYTSTNKTVFGDGSGDVLTLSAGNVGIGDTSPAALFTVGNGDLFQVNSSGAIAAATGITSSGAINFSGTLAVSGTSTLATTTATQLTTTGDTQLATSGGNVGIGTTSPWGSYDKTLTISGGKSTNKTSALELIGGYHNDGNPSSEIAFYQSQYPGSKISNLTNVAGGGDSGSSNLAFYTTANSLSSPSLRMIITNAGNIGIGTTSPAAELHVFSSGNGDIYAERSGGARVGISAQAAAGQFGTLTNHNLQFVTNSSARLTVDTAGNVGIGDTSPAALFTVGNGDLFQVNSSGAIAAATGITSSGTITFSGLTNGILRTNGSGVLSTTTINGSDVTADTLDFTEFKDALTLDASTDISVTGSNVFSITNTGSGNSFVVNDQGSDSTPFVIDASGNVGIGTTPGTYKLYVDGNAYVNGLITAGAVDNNGYNMLRDPNNKIFFGRAAYNSLSESNGNYAPLVRGYTNNLGGFAYYFGYKGLYASTTATGAPQGELNNGANAALFLGVNTDGSTYFNAGNVGIGDTSPASLFTVGNGDLFQVNSSGAIAAATGITSSGTITFSGLTNGILRTNGSGVLSTTTINGSDVTADTLDFTEFKDALTLDATTTVAMSYPLNFDSNTLYIDPTNNRVGVGTASPAGALGVNGDIYVGGSNGLYFNTSQIGIKRATNDLALIASVGAISLTNSSGSFRLASDGNVGIGTTTPAAKLQVLGTSEQLRLSYDASNYTSMTVSSNGSLSINASTNSSLSALNLYAGYNGGIRFWGSSGNSNPYFIIASNTGGGAFAAYQSSGAMISPSNASATVPTLVPNRASTNTGLGASASGALSFITSGTTKVEITNTGDVGIGTTTPSSKLTVAGAVTADSFISTSTATSTFAGGISIAGSIVPAVDNTYSLGTPSLQWQDVYIGPGSLYINGQKVIEEDASNIVVTADTNQSLHLKTAGSGDIELNPTGTGIIALKGNVQITGGKVISTSDNSLLEFEDGIQGGNLSVSGNAIEATNLNGGIAITPNGSGNTYVTANNFGIGTTSPAQKLTIVGGKLQLTDASGGTATLEGDGSSSNKLSSTGWWGFKAGASSGLNFYVNDSSSEAMKILSNGNVGIGDTSPAALFTVGNGDLFQVNSSGAIAAATGITSSGTINFSGLTASRLVATDASKNLVNTITEANLESSVSGVTNIFTNNDTITTANIADSYLRNTGDTATGNYNFDSNTFVIDATNNRVGVGLASPSYALDVNAGTSVSGNVQFSSGHYTSIMLTGDADANSSGPYTNRFVTNGSNGNLEIRNTAQDIFVTIGHSSGNVGIGDTSPAALFTVGSGDLFQVNSSGAVAAATGITSSGAISFTGTLSVTGTSTLATTTASQITASGNVNATRFLAASGSGASPAYSFTDDTDTGMFYSSANGGTMNFVVGGGTRFYAQGTGSYTVFNGNIFAANAGTWLLENTAGSLTNPSIVPNRSSSTTGLGGDGADKLALITAGATALTVDSSQNIGIGTTSPLAKLDVYGDVVLSGSNRYLNFGTAVGTSSYGIRDNAGTLQFKNSGGSWADLGGGGSSLTGTTGQIAYFSGTNTAVGTSTIYLATDGNVGIGTTSPASKLDVWGNLQVGTSSNPAFLVDTATGNVGIGTTTPTTALYISGTDASSSRITLDRSGVTGQLAMTSNDILIAGLGTDGTNGGVQFWAGGSLKAQLLSDGNFGIGTASPAATLDVKIGTSTTEATIASFTANNGRALKLLQPDNADNGDAFTWQTPNAITWRIDATDVLAISSNSKVGVGEVAPTKRLSVTDTVSDAQFIISYDATRYTTFQVDSTGDLIVDAYGDDVRLNDENLWVCAGGSCPSGTPSGNGNVVIENALTIGTATAHSALTIASGGAITVAEKLLTTSGTIAVDWRDGNQQLIRLSTSAATINFSGYVAGQKLTLVTCSPTGSTAGAITWGTTIRWAGNVAPTQTTTAGRCDVWSFLVTAQNTGTLRIFGSQTPNFVD